ncbi:NAD-dependent glycerol-3-phosphate dehydrogenase family protein [Mycobacteroides abscessus MAB_030201_1075]|uniref:Glycerol-3-phosphate dehydrogenase n=1 Tax=Mycobacteroides abscessus MAB_030201_1075 TaxID=1335410 RepID=A0A829PSY8_9MYCO|nr:NAD-dependent glycerol-3-phosphate dehydrogenase family protein [Mycobacteroides abscessus MAB_030201_1075]
MGAGSWGTALGKVLADAGHDVRLWARRSELADEINATHRNSVYLSDVDLPASIVATGVAEEALQGAELVLLAVPSQSLRANLTPWADLIEPNSSVVSLAKGIEVGTLMRMSQVVTQVLGTDPSRVAVLTGPNLASEIAAGQPAATVIGCTDSTRAVALQRAFSTRYFRPYTNSDVVGCEVGGACKNVIALSCGMAAGVGLGENTIATIITRVWPRSPGWDWRSVPATPPWRGWPASEIWWPPVPRRIRGTGLSVCGWATARHCKRRATPPAVGSPRELPHVSPSWRWRRAMTSRCRSPRLFMAFVIAD